MNSDARIGVWKLKQNCSAQSFEGKAFPRAQQQQPRQTFLTAPHRFVFPRDKGCAQKSPRKILCKSTGTIQNSLDIVHRAWRQRPSSFSPGARAAATSPAGVCEQACLG